MTSVTLSCYAFVPSDTNITYYLSPDDGLHWEKVTSGLEHTFTNIGYQLKWKAVFTTSNSSKTPIISSLIITYQAEEEDEGFPLLWVGVIVIFGLIGVAVTYFKKR